MVLVSLTRYSRAHFPKAHTNHPQDRLLRSHNSNLSPTPCSPPPARLQRLTPPQHRPDNPRLDPRRNSRLARNNSRSRIATPLFFTAHPLELQPSPPPPPSSQRRRRAPQLLACRTSPQQTWRAQPYRATPCSPREEELRSSCVW